MVVGILSALLQVLCVHVFLGPTLAETICKIESLGMVIPQSSQAKAASLTGVTCDCDTPKSLACCWLEHLDQPFLMFQSGKLILGLLFYNLNMHH